MTIAEFLLQAKKSTYAKSGEAGEKKLKNGGRVFTYKVDGYTYVDTYFGYDPFFGQELVLENGKVIWVMNYWGKILSDIVSAEEIYNFVRRALLHPDPLVPVRGPENFREGDFSYSNIGGGTVENHFHHVEIIFYKRKKVYELSCHGGMVKTNA